MIRYQTLDGAVWLYGGGTPVGIDAAFDERLAPYVPDVGTVSWADHSALWAATISELNADRAAAAVARALTAHRPDAPTAEEVATALRRLLTHPG